MIKVRLLAPQKNLVHDDDWLGITQSQTLEQASCSKFQDG